MSDEFFAPHERKLIKKVVLWGLAIVVFLAIISWPLGLFQRTANPDRVVGSYEQFFNRCASVQSLETQRDELEAQLEATDEDDESEVRRLRSALTGVKSQRARAINNYNADAENLTRQWFRSEKLPARLDEGTEHTTCTP